MQQTGAGLQPIDVRSATATRGPRRCSRSRAMFGAEVNPRHVMAAVGLLPATPTASCRRRSVSTGLPTLIAPVRDGDGDRARGAGLRPRRRTCWPAAAPSTSTSSGTTATGTRARAHVHALRRGRGGPGHRLGRRTAVRLPRSARTRRRASRSRRASRWAGPSRLRRRDGGRPRARRRRRRAVIEGTVTPVSGRRLLRPRPHADGRLERVPLRPRDVQGGAACRAARSRATRSTRSASGCAARPTRPSTCCSTACWRASRASASSTSRA